MLSQLPQATSESKILQKNSSSLYKLDSSQVYTGSQSSVNHSLIGAQQKS